MPQQYRPPLPPKLSELIALRKAKFPGMTQKDFAAKLNITRLHMATIEHGRRAASMELALRWLLLLAPEARLSVLRPKPIVEQPPTLTKAVRKVSPQAA